MINNKYELFKQLIWKVANCQTFLVTDPHKRIGCNIFGGWRGREAEENFPKKPSAEKTLTGPCKGAITGGFGSAGILPTGSRAKFQEYFTN